MEDLKYKYENFKKCYVALGNVIEIQKQLAEIAEESPVAEDLFISGVIKHFELTYETCWKFLKVYLAEKYDCQALSPKAIFRACETYRLFSQMMINELITLSDIRNLTTHIYDQVLARELYHSIEKHYQVFGGNI